ncbi:glycosyl transferase [Luteimicrobium album]|uniref:Glycosyl transferase n=1 Tax=Luteimicrobium album TaxID=1054550 RepID=A0ABQ6I3C3_9MICO|nr:CDP-glycerol glycerophosphotransferase family protein [Luteimicrobium album]GMA25107.1 glycosyl transferase [Luteimicrobium album]
MPLLRDLTTFSDIVKDTFARRRAQATWDAHLRAHPAPKPGSVEAVIYFADAPVNLYQVRQWYEPMRRLAAQHPTVVLTRDVVTAAALAQEAPLQVVHLVTLAEVESWMAVQRVRLVFYVNQNTRNFQMMRFRDPAHVFISHGESDKDYMASNQLKAYDHTFIAGQAAYERISKRLVDFDVDKHLVRIGRPQVDVEYAGPTLPDDGRTVVLYAPTWEGDRPSMTYSSLRSHAGPMLDVLLATGRHRVIYRPHPRTGAFDPEFKALHSAVVSKLEAANAADASARHLVDTDSPFGWHLAAADVCVCDISAVAFDWLATGKPLLLTEPASGQAEIDRQGLAGLVDTFGAAEAPRVLDVIDHASTPETRSKFDAIVEHYFGDVTPGASMQRFLDASARIIESRHPEAPAA